MNRITPTGLQQRSLPPSSLTFGRVEKAILDHRNQCIKINQQLRDEEPPEEALSDQPLSRRIGRKLPYIALFAVALLAIPWLQQMASKNQSLSPSKPYPQQYYPPSIYEQHTFPQIGPQQTQPKIDAKKPTTENKPIGW